MNNDTPSWDDYFYRMALDAALKSKDSPQVGAVIVRTDDDDQIVVSTGFNGPARGVLDLHQRFEDAKGEPCSECGERPVKEKLRWMCHAEVNAICNAARIGVSLKDSTIYVTKLPCVVCANAIVQAGITRVYTKDPEAWKSDPFDFGDGSVTKQILAEGHVQFHQIKPGRATKKGAPRPGVRRPKGRRRGSRR
jgi:dCMP deaminase